MEGITEEGSCSGRTDGFHKLHFESALLPDAASAAPHCESERVRAPAIGDFVEVQVDLDASGRLRALPIALSSISGFHRAQRLGSIT